MRWAQVPATGCNSLKHQDGYLLQPRHIDYSRLGTLRWKIPEGHAPFDIPTFRDKPYDAALRN